MAAVRYNFATFMSETGRRRFNGPKRRQNPVPAEIRYIIFSTEDIRTAAALSGLKSSMKQQIFEHDISQVNIGEGPDGEPVVVLTLREAGAGRVEIQGAGLMQTLMAFCASRRIPLPARAEKRVELTSGRLALVSRLSVVGANHKTARPAKMHAA